MVRCYFCHKKFLTKKAYFIFNKEMGYNSFCSKACHYKSKLRGRSLICENPLCSKSFYRSPHSISAFNYCSRSCAAIINNQKYPKWPVRYCAVPGCKNPVKRTESKYCSTACGKKGRFKYTQEGIIGVIKKYSEKMDRIPTKRELTEVSHRAINLFGSWNSAIIAAGLEPNRSHDNRMYKRLFGKAKDGHSCDSVSEILIDNWLTENQISHARETKYPTTNHMADWSIEDGKIFIEYFGLAKDSPRYDRSIKTKIKICRKNNIKLIGIYPKHLYPKNKLDSHLLKLL